MAATKAELEYMLAALKADPEAMKDLTDRSRPGYELRLREYRELTRQIAEHDGLREAANVRELDQGALRDQLGGAEYDAVQKALSEAGLN